MLFKSNHEESGNKFSGKIISFSSLNRGFIYHPSLDVDYLYDFHGNDWEQALFSFELFLDFTVKDVFKLNTLLRKQEMKAVPAIVHKIRPGFKMVGLSSFDVFFDNLKHEKFEFADKTYLSQIQNFWWENFLEQLKIIENERTRLELFVKNNKKE